MGRQLTEKAIVRRDSKAEKVRKLAIFMLENRKLSRQEISEQTGIPYQTLCELIRDSDLLQAIRGQASKKMLAMIPLAVQGFEDSLQTKNDKIKFMASQELLRSEKILGPERVDVTVNDNSTRTIEELQEKIKRAQNIPSPTIDAEVIS